MFKIVNGGMLERDTTWTGLIFGSPKVGKTTHGASYSKPLIVDLDKGVHRVSAKDRAGVDVIVCEKWDDVVALATSDMIKSSDYKTIVVDTFGAAVDMIIRDKFSGIMNPAKWGAVKSEIMTVANQLRLTGKSVLFLAHESEEKNDDKIIKRPQCQGKAKEELMKMLDFIGHMGKQGNDFVLEFGGDDSLYVGNTYGFENRYILPDVRLGDNDFGRAVIEKQIADFLAKEAAANTALSEAVATIREQIAQAKEPADFDDAAKAINESDALTKGAQLKMKRELIDAAITLSIKYNADKKCFESDKAQGAE